MLASDQGYIDAGRKGLDESDKALASYTALPQRDVEKQLTEPPPAAAKACRDFFDQAATETVTNTVGSKAQADDPMLKKAAARGSTHINLPQLAVLNRQAADDTVHQARASFEQSLKILVGALVAGILLRLGDRLFLARSIVSAVGKVAAQHAQWQIGSGASGFTSFRRGPHPEVDEYPAGPQSHRRQRIQKLWAASFG